MPLLNSDECESFISRDEAGFSYADGEYILFNFCMIVIHCGAKL